MRCFMTSFAILLALVACGPPAVSAAPEGDTGAKAGMNHGAADTAPALPPAPSSASTPTLAPAPVFSGVPAGPSTNEFGGKPGATQMPVAEPATGVPNNANVSVVANSSGDQWRYRWHNNNWWYWTSENRWVYRNGNEWTNYEPTITFAPAPNSASQSAYGYYRPNPYRYYSNPYGYSTGYGSYYDYGPGYRGGYYGSGRYYGWPGGSMGLGFRRGVRIAF